MCSWALGVPLSLSWWPGVIYKWNMQKNLLLFPLSSTHNHTVRSGVLLLGDRAWTRNTKRLPLPPPYFCASAPWILKSVDDMHMPYNLFSSSEGTLFRKCVIVFQIGHFFIHEQAIISSSRLSWNHCASWFVVWFTCRLSGWKHCFSREHFRRRRKIS